jgi:hypothetical protein
MPLIARSTCPTHRTSVPCTGDQRWGNQRVTPRHTTMMPHFPRRLHPAPQLASTGLAWGYHAVRWALSALPHGQEGIAGDLNTPCRRGTALVEFANVQPTSPWRSSGPLPGRHAALVGPGSTSAGSVKGQLHDDSTRLRFLKVSLTIMAEYTTS